MQTFFRNSLPGEERKKKTKIIALKRHCFYLLQGTLFCFKNVITLPLLNERVLRIYFSFCIKLGKLFHCNVVAISGHYELKKA